MSPTSRSGVTRTIRAAGTTIGAEPTGWRKSSAPDDRERDTVVKRLDHTQARIPEYRIVNPGVETVTVLALDGGAYAGHGVFRRGRRAEPVCLDGFFR